MFRVWVAKLSHIHVEPVLPSALLQQFLQPHIMEECTPQCISNVVWAMGRMGAYWPFLVRTLGQKAMSFDIWIKLQPRDVAMIVWGASRLGLADAPLMYSLAYRLAYNFEWLLMNVEETAWYLEGCADTGFNPPWLMRFMLRLVDKSLVDFNAKQMSMIIKSLARLKILNRDMFDGLVYHAFQPNMVHTPETILNILQVAGRATIHIKCLPVIIDEAYTDSTTLAMMAPFITDAKFIISLAAAEDCVRLAVLLTRAGSKQLDEAVYAVVMRYDMVAT